MLLGENLTLDTGSAPSLEHVTRARTPRRERIIRTQDGEGNLPGQRTRKRKQHAERV
ncbi:MAG: hypothetical protein ACK5SI_14070 [Planctomycetia bacterium]|jgi:hypothetical protein